MANKRSMKRNQSGITFVLTPKLGLRLGKPVKFEDAGTAAEALELWAEKAEKRGVQFDPDRDVELAIWDGDDEGAMQLADAMLRDGMLHPTTIDAWYDHVEDAHEAEKAAMFYAVEHQGGYSTIWDVWKAADDELRPMEGDTRAYAEDFVDSCGGLKEALGDRIDYYFDYESFGRDIRSDEESNAQSEIDDLESQLDEEEQEDDPDLEMARENLERIENMSDRQLGEDMVESIGMESLGDMAENYFDWDAYVRDLEQDVTEFEFAGSTWAILDV
jgi:antirestriction protein